MGPRIRPDGEVMTSPFLAVHHRHKSAVIRTDERRIILKVFEGRTAKRRALAYLDAVLVGWFSRSTCLIDGENLQ